MCGTNKAAALSALVLAGGQSRRMGTDKANLSYTDDGVPQWKRMTTQLQELCPHVCVSVRRDQELEGYHNSDAELIIDGPESKGPLTGMLQAFTTRPESAWLVVACDLPSLELPVVKYLLQYRGSASAIAYRSASDGLPEPMCAIYEPDFRQLLQSAMENDIRCPRKILLNHPDRVRLLDLPQEDALENANTPEELQRLRNRIHSRNS